MPAAQTQEAQFELILNSLNLPFWQNAEFWIATILAVAGLVYSILAFREARKAKAAATEAGRTVKLQTVTLELTELLQKLERIHPDIRFNDARLLLNEVSRRVRRHVSPFAHRTELKASIESVIESLDAAQESLKSVRPADPEKEDAALNAVFNAIEGNFTSIGNGVADLLGLFEKITLDFGDDDEEG